MSGSTMSGRELGLETAPKLSEPDKRIRPNRSDTEPGSSSQLHHHCTLGHRMATEPRTEHPASNADNGKRTAHRAYDKKRALTVDRGPTHYDAQTASARFARIARSKTRKSPRSEP